MNHSFDASSPLAAGHAQGELVIKSESGTLLYAEPARVDLSTGAVTLENAISRTGYDWGCDTFCFRLSKRGDRFEVEEGCEVDPNLDFCVSSDLENLQEAWRQKLAKDLDKGLPKNRSVPRRPRM
jgi:hypothetical protein